MKTSIDIPSKSIHVDDVLINRDGTSTEFVRALSHDLRTPLNVIIGICQFLERDSKTPLSPIHHDAVIRMERNARSLLESVNHVLECLRSGRFE